MKTIAFHKMHGCGNDFIVIDNRELSLPVDRMADWAIALCERKLGVGADGLVFLQQAPAGWAGTRPDYIWHFYNADGSRGEMCGNASRCVSWLAVDLDLAGPKHVFGTDAGLIRAEVDYPGRASTVELTRPHGLKTDTRLDVLGVSHGVHFVNTGVPHAVIFFQDAADADVFSLGRALRNHPHFSPRGTNANFVSVTDKNHIKVRTYERGVEGETLACGTGAAASALISHHLGLTGTDVDVTTSGGEVLGISLRGDAAFLSGAVTRVFTGSLDPEFLSLA